VIAKAVAQFDAVNPDHAQLNICRDGVWGWRLFGVLSEAVAAGSFERVTAVRAHFILPDGRISR
jgi:hypothetical protein